MELTVKHVEQEYCLFKKGYHVIIEGIMLMVCEQEGI